MANPDPSERNDVTVTIDVLHNSGHALKVATIYKDEWVGYGAFPEHERPRVNAAEAGDKLTIDVPYWLARQWELVE